MKDLVFIVLSCLFLVGCQQKKDYVKQVTTKLECLDKNPIVLPRPSYSRTLRVF